MTGRRKNDLDPMTGRRKTDWHPQRRGGSTTFFLFFKFLSLGGTNICFQIGEIAYFYSYFHCVKFGFGLMFLFNVYFYMRIVYKILALLLYLVFLRIAILACCKDLVLWSSGFFLVIPHTSGTFSWSSSTPRWTNGWLNNFPLWIHYSNRWYSREESWIQGLFHWLFAFLVAKQL